jgi:hypothetical protein
MTDKVDRENIRAIIIRVADGTIDDWLTTLEVDELEYALNLLLTMNTSKAKFLDSI